VVEVPAGTEPRDYAQFRLGAQLPYPLAEAIVDATPAGGRRYLAAAVRQDVAAAYEALGPDAGLASDRVELAPLAALAVLRRTGPHERRLDVVLGDAAFSMALFVGATALALRSRRRDDDVGRIAREIVRTALLAAPGTNPRVRLVGSGAPRVAQLLADSGFEAEVGWGPVGALPAHEADEQAWLGAGLT
jgi:hypothetical protein